MRRYILTCIAACIYYSGLVGIARWWTRRRGKRLVILNYHQASGGDLERHLLYLRRHYRILPLEKALEELYSYQTKRLRGEDRRTLAAVTFDDGYYDNYSYAFALAKRLCVPLTLYLIPGYIGKSERFWWHEGKQLVAQTQLKEVEYDGQYFDLRRHKGREALAAFINMRLRFASSIIERKNFLGMIRQLLAVPAETTEEERSGLPLSWEQVLEMERSHWITFGAHTMHHPILSCLAEQCELQYEIEECRNVLEERLGHAVTSFAYPIGQWYHIDLRTLRAVQRANYNWAVTTNYGINTPQSYPYQLKRVESDVSQHWLVLAAEAAGLWGFFSRLRWHPFIRRYLTNARSVK
jgi:peptidoglycan/xylan/chitin deacetylase (PgdA/CDA1 family)